MYKIEYYKNEAIVQLTIQEQITVDEIEQIAHELYSGSATNPLMLLLDASKMMCDIDFIDFNKLINLAEKYANEEKIIYEAIIAQTPTNYVLFTFYGDIIKRNKHSYKIFNTEKAALEWLKNIKI